MQEPEKEELETPDESETPGDSETEEEDDQPDDRLASQAVLAIMEEQEIQRETGDIPISDFSRNESTDLLNPAGAEGRQPDGVLSQNRPNVADGRSNC